MKEDKEKLVNFYYSAMWAGDNSRRRLTFLEKGRTPQTETTKFALMFWNLTVAVFYNKNLQETYAYLHN